MKDYFWITIALTTIILTVLFIGKPDLYDVLLNRLSNGQVQSPSRQMNDAIPESHHRDLTDILQDDSSLP